MFLKKNESLKFFFEHSGIFTQFILYFTGMPMHKYWLNELEMKFVAENVLKIKPTKISTFFTKDE